MLDLDETAREIRLLPILLTAALLLFLADWLIGLALRGLLPLSLSVLPLLGDQLEQLHLPLQPGSLPVPDSRSRFPAVG